MLTSKFPLSAAWLLLLLLVGTTSAAPARDQALAARQAAQPTDPWVTVDEDGHARTITPVLATVSGVPTLLSAAPYEVTATVFTMRPWGYKTTSTGAAQPVATNDKGAGAFAACRSSSIGDGGEDFKPFCLPKHQDTYYTGPMHFITWDPSYFPTPNTTIKVLGFYTPNTTSTSTTGSGSTPFEGESEAFSSGEMAAGWGYWQWRADKSLLSSQSLTAANITIRIVFLSPATASAQAGGSRSNQTAVAAPAAAARWVQGPTILLTYRPGPPAVKSKSPDAGGLYIALPAVSAFAMLMVVGTFFCNRQARTIGIGNVMSRRGRRDMGGRRGKRTLLFGKMGSRKSDSGDSRIDREQSIRLMSRDANADDDHDHDEVPWDYWDAEEDQMLGQSSTSAGAHRP
ncbi:hypothetical protein N656DRAFT_774527, partial [Canariomyces notabilis]